jgi:hypothetical protein
LFSGICFYARLLVSGFDGIGFVISGQPFCLYRMCLDPL